MHRIIEIYYRIPTKINIFFVIQASVKNLKFESDLEKSLKYYETNESLKPFLRGNF